MLLRIFFLLSFCAAIARGETLRVQGSAIVAQVLDAAKIDLQDQLGLDLKIITEGGSMGGFLAVGSEATQLALCTKPIEGSERALFPAASFDQAQIGWQVLGLAVARDVWEAGVQALTKEQMIGIYEGTIRNWKQVGGPDQPIKFYNPKRGRGVWELFVTWLYGDQRLAQLGDSFETVVTYKDARDSVEFNRGSITVLPPDFADGKSIFLLGIKLAEGTIVRPDLETLAANKYPLVRPLFIVSNRRFAGSKKKLVDYLLSPSGQKFVQNVHFAPIKPPVPAVQVKTNP